MCQKNQKQYILLLSRLMCKKKMLEQKRFAGRQTVKLFWKKSGAGVIFFITEVKQYGRTVRPKMIQPRVLNG